MNKVAIFVDSTADLNKEHYQKLDINVVPLLVNIGGKAYKDGLEIDSELLYKLVAEHGELPTTAAVPPYAFIEAFKPLIDKGYDIYYVGIGGKLSATLQSVVLAAQEFPEGRVFYTDSNNLSSGSGLLALKAARYRDEGKSASEIKQLVDAHVEKVNSVFAIETLDYLHKGGRCSGTAKVLGKLFHIHPLIKVTDGKLIVYKKPRGRMNAALDELVSELKGHLPNVDMDQIMVTHAGVDQANLDYLVKELSQIVDAEKIVITHAGGVISSHCGYGTIGVLYIRK
ncbi:MAG: DegV family protein [Bacteroidia bacterium]|nr:DegV family protein [Bacteroidia bacterium]